MNLISIKDARENIDSLLKEAMRFKARRSKRRIDGKSIALIFEKPSTRTRVSFEVAVAQLGGYPLMLRWEELQISRGEEMQDTSMALSRYVDCIVVRAADEKINQIASHSSVPVINGLSEFEHPCQALSDLLTIKEKKGEFKGLKLAYIGDGNNVCNSLLLGSAIVGMDMTAACPSHYEPDVRALQDALKIADETGCKILIERDPRKAVKGADIIYTDVWVSMGQESEQEERLERFKDYQVNEELVDLGRDPIVMHCLPAHRGQEITDGVIDGKNSVIFDQAENRLHMAKAILSWLLR